MNKMASEAFYSGPPNLFKLLVLQHLLPVLINYITFDLDLALSFSKHT